MEVCDFLNTNPISESKARELSPQVMAFVGDAVHTLYIRTKLAETSTAKSHTLHLKTSKEVKASAQAHKMEIIFPSLTEEEQYIYKRGRNAKTGAPAKNASMIDYRIASGFEALLGYLYLTGKYERLLEILKLSEVKDNG